MFTRTSISFAACLALLVTATPGHGQATPTLDELDTLVYVGTRTPLPLEKSSPSISVFRQDDFSLRQWDTLVDVLGAASGTHVARSGQEGALASLFTRGTNSDHTTLLLNGRRLNPGFSGFYSVGQLPLTGNTQVEIQRGATSALYGAEGIGGVINLRTDQHLDQDGQDGQARLEAGAFRSLNSALNHQFARAGWRGNVAVSRQATDNDLPNHQLRQWNFQSHLETSLSPVITADLQLFAYDSSIGLPGNRKSPGFPQLEDFQDDQLWMISPGLTIQPAPGHQLRAFVSHSENNLRGLTSSSFGTIFNDFRTRTTQVDIQYDLGAGEKLLWSAGIGYQNLDFLQVDLNAAPGAPPTTDNRWQSWSAFLQQQWQITEQLRSTAAVRIDDYSAFDSPVTGHAELAYNPGSGPLTVFVKAARAYAIPQAFDIFGAFGNPELDAEKSESYEAGFRFLVPDLNWALAAVAFQNNLKELIVFTPQWVTDNVGKARTRGLELSLRGDLGVRARYWVQYTYLEASNLDNQTRLARRPRHTAQTGFQWQALDPLALSAEFLWVADREDIDGGTFMTISPPDYHVARLAARWEFENSPFALTARVENLLNRNYDTVDGFAAPSRAAYVGLAARW